MRCVVTMAMCLALLAFCSARPISATPSTIAIDDLTIDPQGQTGMRFTNSIATSLVRVDAGERMKMRGYASDDGFYIVYVAFDKTSPTTPPSDINYYLYSQAATVGGDMFTEHVVVGTPRGDFSDQWSWVKYHLTENGTHSGSLEIPVHSFSNAALISVEPDSSAGTVYLSQPQHKITFSTKNSLKGFEVTLDSADLTSDNDYYWKWSDTDHRYHVSFDVGNSNPPWSLFTAPLNGIVWVRPNLWRSLSGSAGAFKSGQFQDVLNLTLRYNAGLGGNPRAVSVPINIRFKPPWWSLFCCAVIGAFLGSLVTLFFPDTWKGKTPARTIESAIVLAVVAEFLGLLMFQSDDSKLIVAGFNLNPTEVLPALGLGLLVGLLGLKVLDAFKIPLPTR